MKQARFTMIAAIAMGVFALPAISIAAPPAPQTSVELVAVAVQSAAIEMKSQAADKCREGGERRFRSGQHDSCAGFWNIYASIQGGWTWWSDKAGNDPEAQRIDAKAKSAAAALKRCGIDAHVSLSDWFQTFSPGLVVIHSSPHTTLNAASQQISIAKKCGINGYSKRSPFTFVGND